MSWLIVIAYVCKIVDIANTNWILIRVTVRVWLYGNANGALRRLKRAIIIYLYVDVAYIYEYVGIIDGKYEYDHRTTYCTDY